MSAPKQKKDDFEALFESNFKRKISSAQIEKICWQIAITALMQPFQYDFRCPAATDNGITHAAAAPRNLDAASTVRSGETELQTAIELRATASEIAALKPDLDANHLRQNGENLLTNHYRSLGAATPIRFPMSSCKKTIVLRMQPRHQAILMQPVQCVQEHHVAI